MLPLPIRGDKAHVRILENGAQVGVNELTSVTDSEASQKISHHLIGEKKPREDVQMMGFEGSLNGIVLTPALDRLIQRIRDARKSGVNLPVINILYVITYSNQETVSWLFTDVQLILGSRTIGGAPEPLTRNINFSASDWREV